MKGCVQWNPIYGCTVNMFVNFTVILLATSCQGIYRNFYGGPLNFYRDVIVGEGRSG